MKLKSIVRHKNTHVPIEVEISLVPGLPVIQFLGLPDRVIQESSQRIKSAIQSQGFQFPRAQQVIVNLYPSDLKKSSVGIELAVALGILVVTGQASETTLKDYFIYGSLGLDGAVRALEDLRELKKTPTLSPVLTGVSHADLPVSRFEIDDLKSYFNPRFIEGSHLSVSVNRPTSFLDLEIPKEQETLVKILALGEFSCLLAGPSGSGKTTLAKILHELIAPPQSEDLEEIILNNDIGFAEQNIWRPLIHPHHSISISGLIGGGVPIVKGELFRAHGGVLILDELLEFSPSVVESLREPLEEGVIRLRKSHFRETHRANIMTIATTNLCPCGDWTPQTPVICGRSLGRCRSYLEKLSGPIVDRFNVMFFTKGQNRGETIRVHRILEEVEETRNFRRETSQTNSTFKHLPKKWTLSDLQSYLPDFYMRELFPKHLTSRRRLLSTLQVARCIADLHMSVPIEPQHIEEAMTFTMRPFEMLKRLNI